MLSEVIMVRTGRTGVLIRRGSNVLLDTEEKPSEDTVKTYLQARRTCQKPTLTANFILDV